MAWTYAGAYGPVGLVDNKGNAQTGAEVEVYDIGTSTLATLWESRDKSTEADNPVDVDSNGNVTFFADPGRYDAVVRRDGIKLYEYEVHIPPDPAEPHAELHEPGGSDSLSGTYNRRFSLDARNYEADASGATSSAQAVKDALNDLDTDTAGSRTSQSGTHGRGEVLLAEGIYLIDSTIDLLRHQRIRIAESAVVLVPNGFASRLFRFLSNGTNGVCLFANVHVEGSIYEDGTPARNWTAFTWLAEEDASGGPGMSFCRVTGTGSVWDPGTAFDLVTTDTSNPYITSCGANDLTVYYPVVVWDWNPFATNKVHSNEFYNVGVQSNASFTHGVRNLQGKRNSWYGCRLWDISGSQVSMEITADAEDTLIVGGQMTSATFTDNGARTLTVDTEQGVTRGGNGFHKVNEPSVRVERSTNQSIPDSTTTAIDWETAVFDNTGGLMWQSGTASDVDLPEAGIYDIFAGIGWDNNSTGRRLVEIKVNDGSWRTVAANRDEAYEGTQRTLSTRVNVSAGARVRINIVQTSGASLDVIAESVTFLSAQKVAEL